MITIINISDAKFSYNGINYFKNFTPFVTGNKVSIVNTYDSCISLTNFPTIYSDISVDGVTYGSVAALQNALLPVLFNRTFSQSGSLTTGYIPKATGSNVLGDSLLFENGYNIGIGTNTPNYVSSGRRVVDINGSSQSMLALSIAGSPSAYLYTSSSSLELNASGARPIYFSNNNAVRITIDSNGYFGIGTQNPISILHSKVLANTNNYFTQEVLSSNTWAGNLIRYNSVDYMGSIGNVSTGEYKIGGFNSSGYFVTFYTNNSERMRITSSGQVNIGSTSFAGDELLMVSMNGTANSQAINVKDRNASAVASTFMVFRKSDDTFLGNVRRNGTENGLYLGGNDNLVLGTGGNTERLRLNSSGQIEIKGNSTATNAQALITNSDTDFNFYASNASGVTKNINFLYNGGSGQALRITSGGYLLLGTTNSAYGNSTRGTFEMNGSSSSLLALKINDSIGAYLYTSSVNSELYSTLPLTFAVNGLERMRISSDGNIGLGTTNPINGGGAARWITTEGTTNYSGGLVASINGNAKAYFYSQDDYAIVQGSSGQGVKLMPNGVNGLIIYSNTNYQFTGSNVSDKRAKTKIQDLQINSLEKIMALKSKSYYMKNDPTKIKYGFIAQDVNEILPDLINGDLNGEDFIGLDYIGIIPILTNAIQELKAEIEILKN